MASTIAQLIMEQGRQSAESRTELAKIAANALTSNASAAAEAARQKGAIWGGAINQIGQSIAAIPGNIERAKTLDLQRQDIAAQVQERQATAKKQQDAEAEGKAVDAIMAQSMDPQGNLDAEGFTKKLIAGGHASALKVWAPFISSAVDAKMKRDEANQKVIGEGLFAAYQEATPDAMKRAAKIMGANGAITPDDAAKFGQLADALAQSPPEGQDASARTLIAHLGSSNPAFVERLDRHTTQQAALKKSDAETQASLAKAAESTSIANKNQAEVAGTMPAPPTLTETVRHNKEMERIDQLKVGREEAAQQETARHNRAMEGQGDAALSLTPEAKALTAHQYAMTGQLPPMGMGKEGAKVRTSIINEAAKIYQGLDLPSQQAAFKANQASLTKLQGTADKVSAFENTAGKNLDQFLSLAEKIPDTGVPWVNTPIRAVNAKMVGDTNQAAFNAARDVALREIARVTSDPNLTGVLSDSARREVQSLSPENATFGQIKAVAKVLKQDMANVKAGLSDQITDVRQRIATPPGGTAAPAAAGPAVGTVRSANGETRKWTGSEWVLVK